MLGAALEAGEAVDGVIAESGAQAASLWALREHITESEARAGKGAKHDISVPLIEIPAFLEAGEAALQAIPGLILNVFGHLGDGNLHYNVVMPKTADSDAINRLVHDVVARFGGSISAEHGIGQYRVGELARLRAPNELALAQALKGLIDPRSIMNPGKVLSRPKGET
jgi:FAD/FMN-containing dehydrogenase